MVERYLKTNGLSSSASSQKIKDLLKMAHWHPDDIDTALVLLHKKPVTRNVHVNSFSKVLYTDQRLQPETISALLGVEVDIRLPAESLVDDRYQLRSVIVLVTICVALCALATLWYLSFNSSFVG